MIGQLLFFSRTHKFNNVNIWKCQMLFIVENIKAQSFTQFKIDEDIDKLAL